MLMAVQLLQLLLQLQNLQNLQLLLLQHNQAVRMVQLQQMLQAEHQLIHICGLQADKLMQQLPDLLQVTTV